MKFSLKCLGKFENIRSAILLGDRVSVEMSPYDLSRGRITYRSPVMSGIRFIHKLRASGITHVPIIATSLNVPTSHGRIALAAGCVAHIEKPLEPDQLDELLDRFLPGQRADLISYLVH